MNVRPITEIINAWMDDSFRFDGSHRRSVFHRRTRGCLRFDETGHLRIWRIIPGMCADQRGARTRLIWKPGGA